jgi:hypothetical protein
MNAAELWQALNRTNAEQVERVSHQVGPVSGTAQELVDRICDLSSSATIASEKLGYFGNPYEQLAEDYVFLLAAAKRLSGLKARLPWERT